MIEFYSSISRGGDTMINKINASEGEPLRLFLGTAPCGTAPSISEEEGTELNFARYWVPNPKDSYSVIATGDSMRLAKVMSS